MDIPEVPEVPAINDQSMLVSVFDQVTPVVVAKEQSKDLVLGLVHHYVMRGQKPQVSFIAKIGSKVVCKYLLPLESLAMKQGVLNHLYVLNDVE